MSRSLKKGSVVADRKVGFKATHRHARISATKVRPLANMVRGKFADEALKSR